MTIELLREEREMVPAARTHTKIGRDLRRRDRSAGTKEFKAHWIEPLL